MFKKFIAVIAIALTISLTSVQVFSYDPENCSFCYMLAEDCANYYTDYVCDGNEQCAEWYIWVYCYPLWINCLDECYDCDGSLAYEPATGEFVCCPYGGYPGPYGIWVCY